MTDRAFVVDPDRVDAALAGLRAQGLYDASRGIQETDRGAIAIPITGEPTDLEGRVVEQADPVRRERTLADRLAAEGWSDDALDRLPNSWAVIGDIVLVRFPDDCPDRTAVAEALMDLQGADTVLARHGIEGAHREPAVEVIAGSGDTETIHTEHGTKYALDVTKVMFSPGNKAERVRMGEVVSPGERVLDMFAGIGYFALPMARAGAHVTAIERNPDAFGYLVENAALNEVEPRLTPFLGDCREVVESFPADGSMTFDRVVMGYYDARDYLDAGLAALAPGGRLHLHEAAPTVLIPDRAVDALEAAADDRGLSVESTTVRTVKTHAEGVTHVVIDATVR